ncbi:chitin deacetylase [Phlyctochytrium planicorne]|nr:chitin deacetylase [Phlyctochytrium planicorne]
MRRTLSTSAIVAGILGLTLGLFESVLGQASSFPSVGTVPPAFKEWTDFYLAGKNIPNIPVRTAPTDSPDYRTTFRTCVNPLYWAQTFDDGPSPASIAILNDYKAKGLHTTFFNIGGNILKSPCVLKQKEDEGHVNCLHTWSHSALTTLTNDEIVAEVVWNSLAIYQVTGRAPRCIRPPYGDVDERVAAILKAMGLIVVWVNLDTNDWQMETGRTAASVMSVITEAIADPPAGGVVSLQHDIFDYVTAVGVEATAAILASGKFTLVDLNQCLGTSGLGDGFTLPSLLPVLPRLGTC